MRQVAALTAPLAWLGEGFIKWLMHDKMLRADLPRTGGQLAATGLAGCLELLLEPAGTTGSPELSSVKFTGFPATRAERSKALMVMFQPYAEFQLPIERKEFSELPPFLSARPDEPPAQMVAALEDSTLPPAQRFGIAIELTHIPKPRYQEVAAAGWALATRDLLGRGSAQAVAEAANRLPTGHGKNQHPAWIKAAADTAAMTAAAYKSQAKGQAWSDNSIIKHIIEAAIFGHSTELAAEMIHTSGTGLLERIVSKSERYRIGLAVSSLSCEGTAPRMEETVMARLMPMAEQYGETADMPVASRMQCLALLCREPTVAYRLKTELERVATEIRPECFQHRGTILGGLDTREAWYLEAAFLGNLLRDGRHDEVAKRLETVLADPSDYEAGNMFLSLCIRVFHEHVLSLLADGRQARVADIITLSLRLYASIMGPENGWNYRDDATIFVELCHAAGKRYAEFETWLAHASDETRADYRQRRYGPKEFKIPGISAFHRLAVFSDLRRGGMARPAKISGSRGYWP